MMLDSFASAILVILGLIGIYWDNGKQNGNHRFKIGNILGL